MKKLLIAVCTLFTLSSVGQNPWYNTVPVKIGYGSETWNVDPVINNFSYKLYDNVNGNSLPPNLSENTKFTYPRYIMDFEAIGKHFYFDCNTNGGWDLLLRDLPKGYEEVGDAGLLAQRIEWIPTKLAWGSWIKDKYGIYVGGNYAWDIIAFSKNGIADEYLLGGHKRGFHVQGMVNLNRLLIKGFVQYDWLNVSKGASKGTGQSFDLEAYYALGKKRTVGVFAGINLEYWQQKGPKGTPTEDWYNKGIQNEGIENYSYELPDMSASITAFRIGFYTLLFQLKSYDWQDTE